MMYSAYKLNRQTDNIQSCILSQFWTSLWFHSGTVVPVWFSLTCVQVSQETSKVIWYSHLFKNFPHFLVIDTAAWSLLLLGPYISVLYWAHHCMKYSLGISNFLEEISSLSILWFPLFLCICRWRRLSYLSLLFCGTLHSVGYIFPFLLCLLLLFFSQLFVSPLWTTSLPSCISFSLEWFWSLPSI